MSKEHQVRLKPAFGFLKAGSDPWISAVTFCLILFGSVMVISTNQGTTVGSTTSLIAQIIKQAAFAIIAWACIVFLSRFFSWKLFVKARMPLFVIYLALLLATAAFGTNINGSKAWLYLGGVSIQPSELGKPLMICYLACSLYMARKKPELRESFIKMFAWPLALCVVSCIFLPILQKDIGSWIITMGIAIIGMLIPAYPSLRKTQTVIVAILAVGVIGVVYFVYFSGDLIESLSSISGLSHVVDRIENMRNPYLDILDAGYQPANGLYAIAEGGLFGKGLGQSVRKYGFLTQAESDYILAIVIEETGLLGFGGITLGYGILCWRLFYHALKSKNTANKTLYICSASYLLLHYFINVGGVSTLIPMTGVPLLLISAGGSSLIAVCIILGVCQNRIAMSEENNIRKGVEA